MTTDLTSIAQDVAAAFPRQWDAPELPLIADRPLGDDPWTVADAFAAKRDWTALTGRFLDRNQAALGILPDEAACFYLPAFLVADLAGELDNANVVFHLTHGLSGKTRGTRPEGPFCGGQTWWQHAVDRWSRLTASQVRAVARFLEYRAAVAEDASDIVEALEAYWLRRAAGEVVIEDTGRAAVAARRLRTLLS